MSDEEKRRIASETDINAACAILMREPVSLRAPDWRDQLTGLDQPGLYSWFVDDEGAKSLSEAFEENIEAGLIYGGQTGATKWPSGKQTEKTLSDRLIKSHLAGKIRQSTFRLTLAACLRRQLELVMVANADRQLEAGHEDRLSYWIREHLSLTVFPYRDRNALLHLEEQVLAKLDPPLNLDGMPSTPIRRRLSALRKPFRDGTAAPRSSAAARAPAMHQEPPNRSNKRVTLHEEIADILSDRSWTDIPIIAQLVSTRGRYRKRDGSVVTPNQISARLSKHPDLFDRARGQARLR